MLSSSLIKMYDDENFELLDGDGDNDILTDFPTTIDKNISIPSQDPNEAQTTAKRKRNKAAPKPTVRDEGLRRLAQQGSLNDPDAAIMLFDLSTEENTKKRLQSRSKDRSPKVSQQIYRPMQESTFNPQLYRDSNDFVTATGSIWTNMHLPDSNHRNTFANGPNYSNHIADASINYLEVGVMDRESLLRPQQYHRGMSLSAPTPSFLNGLCYPTARDPQIPGLDFVSMHHGNMAQIQLPPISTLNRIRPIPGVPTLCALDDIVSMPKPKFLAGPVHLQRQDQRVCDINENIKKFEFTQVIQEEDNSHLMNTFEGEYDDNESEHNFEQQRQRSGSEGLDASMPLEDVDLSLIDHDHGHNVVEFFLSPSKRKRAASDGTQYNIDARGNRKDKSLSSVCSKFLYIFGGNGRSSSAPKFAGSTDNGAGSESGSSEATHDPSKTSEITRDISRTLEVNQDPFRSENLEDCTVNSPNLEAVSDVIFRIDEAGGRLGVHIRRVYEVLSILELLSLVSYNNRES